MKRDHFFSSGLVGRGTCLCNRADLSAAAAHGNRRVVWCMPIVNTKPRRLYYHIHLICNIAHDLCSSMDA